ncbi:MAG TPA: PEP-CTERM sorting domain-containing protein [Tepidisphaeraceae bacterium]|jgi:hypothetical protein
MSRLKNSAALLGAAAAVSFPTLALADAFFASDVVSYDAGDLTNNSWTNSAGAIGKPAADTGFGVLTPFNSAFSASHITGIGAGGQLTLKLAQTAAASGMSIGVHAAVGLIDFDWPNGNPGASATPFTYDRMSKVELSYDGQTWVSAGTHSFTRPTNFYAQGVTTPGYQETVANGAEVDWSKPFTSPLSAFNGQQWNDMLQTLSGSAGGDWINLSAPQLPGINYVRFSVPAGTTYPMIVDSVVGNTDNQVNTGVRNLSSSPIVEAPQGTIFRNDGTLTHSGDVTVMGASPQAGSALLNYGTLRAGTGATVTYNVPVYNEGGTLAAVEGILRLNSRFITKGTTTKAGPAVLEINGPQYHAPGATFLAAGGRTKFQTNAKGLNLKAAARVEFNSPQNLANLEVQSSGKVTVGAGGANTLVTDTLSVAATGVVDLTDNDLIVEHGDYNTISNLRWQGYRDSADSAATGIISTTGQTMAGHPILALFDNTMLQTSDWPFGAGNSVGASAVLGQFAYIGDADLNGMVTPDDYGAVDANLGQHPGIAEETGGMNWFAGDWNFDGDITPDDYLAIDANLGNGESSSLAATGLVPEPGSLSLLGLAGATLLRRRKHS